MTFAILGRLALWSALALCAYGIVATAVGIRRGVALLVESARTTAYAVAALIAVAVAMLLAAIVTDDFTIAYVAGVSSRATPLFYKVLSLWAADRGSLLLWTLILSGYVAVVAVRFRSRRPVWFPWSLAALFGSVAFFLVLVIGPASPFATSATVPVDGQGPPALLQNHPLMAIHPPALYLGFIGMVVPFAFAIGALATGSVSQDWVRSIRSWIVVPWMFLTAGLVLGALWSYTVLGWGGYWAWDPVENLALLPWLTATALLHSLRVHERRGTLQVWTLSLIVATYALTVLGTFLTRGDVLISVHAFADSATGPLFLAYLTLVLVGGFGLLAWRSPDLSAGGVDQPISREGSFLANNLVLVAAAFTVLLGTMYPLAEEAINGRQVSVGGPYFDRNVVPLVLVLLLLMGIGPLASWRATSARSLLLRLRAPALFAAAVAVIAVVAGMRGLGTVLATSLVAFAAASTVTGMVPRRPSEPISARGVARDLRAQPRRFGGVLAHLGLLVAIFGITLSSSFAHTADLTIAQGSSTTFQGYDVRLEAVGSTREPQRTVVAATLTLSRDGQPVATMTPAVNMYVASSQAAASPALRVGTPANGLTDISASLLSLSHGGRTATIRLTTRSGTSLLWLGGLLTVLGGLLALAPVRRRRAPVVAPPVLRPEEMPAGVGV